MLFSRMAVSFTLWAQSSPAISLYKTLFVHTGLSIHATAIRGKNVGGYGNFGSFLWSKGVQGLFLLSLRVAIDAQRTHTHIPLTGAAITGGKGSLAAALDSAILSQKTWIREMFGEVQGCRSLSQRLFPRANSGLHIGPEVGVEINSRILDGKNILFYIDNCKVENIEMLSLFLKNYEFQLKQASIPNNNVGLKRENLLGH